MANNNREVPCLPNEVLSVVIEQCSDNLPLLYNLLFVNRYFFTETIKYLYKDPFALLQRFCLDPRYYPKMSSRFMRLEGLILSSLLSYSGKDWIIALDENTIAPVNFHRARRLVKKYLEDYPDDRLLAPAGEHGVSTTQSNYAKLYDKRRWQSEKPNIFKKLAFSMITVGSTEPTYPDITVLDPKKTIANYSKYLWTTPWGRQWRPFIESQSSACFPLDTGSHMMDPLLQKVESLFIRCNAAHFRELHLAAGEVPRIVALNLHREFKSLKVLEIRHGGTIEDMSYYYTNDLLRFIREHRDTFPAKSPLDLTISSCFRMGDWYDNFQCRQHVSKPNALLEYYLALGTPVRMKACRVPKFYESQTLAEIDTSILQSFKDSMDRVALSDDEWVHSRKEALTVKIRAFLSTCPRLKDLELFVSDVDLFRSDRELQNDYQGCTQTELHQTTPILSVTPGLRSLRKITLRRPCHHQLVIGALNDAVAAFGSSLIEVEGIVRADGLVLGRPPLPTEESGFLPQSVQLSKRCNTLGFWSAPFLRSIRVRVAINTPSIQMGDLSGCPQLEELCIEVVLRFTATNHESSSQDTSHYQEHLSLDSFDLFPKWKLPKLRTLELSTAAAIRFNFESFEDGMPNLVTAKITMDSRSRSFMRDHAERIPQISKHFKLNSGRNLYLPVQPDDDEGWTKKWQLPSLRWLTLVGPCACLFNLDRLVELPLLEDLNLGYALTSDPILPDELANDPPFGHTNDLRSSTTFGNLEDDIHARLQRQPPLTKSKLNSIGISGRWIKDKDELVDLLTIYAPNTRTLVIHEPGNANFSNGPAWFLKSIIRSTEIARSQEYLKQIGATSSPSTMVSSLVGLVIGSLVTTEASPQTQYNYDASIITASKLAKLRPGDGLIDCKFESPFPYSAKETKLPNRFRQVETIYGREREYDCVFRVNREHLVRDRSA
ncbi:hypothetical protein BGW38_003568 [Lunasporangiospora selenospora]|uniref:F-box domain-containing protein n=1 Tax=Lunasporangiospora selenospora TaxID=979761 RepID=A0A9P6KHV5_9FUNG|nr:hypothetical protein BGW38_003568 [Lunasporangiospora selenospora]